MPQWLWMTITVTLAVLLVLTWVTREKKEEATPQPAPPEPAKKRASDDGEEKRVTVEAKPSAKSAGAPAEKAPLPKLDYEEDEEVDPTKVGPASAGAKPAPIQAPAKKIIYDEDAAEDEPTHSGALILVTATAQTDRGLRRKRNEDSVLAMPEAGVFVVADGMGGYRGGEIASGLAVTTIEKAFRTGEFEGEPHDSIPPRASELARAIQMANEAIRARVATDKELEGMGTTICAARFSPKKQRLYIGHVGDSRVYRVRDGELKQMTADHTMKDLGVTGAAAAHLSRAVGVWPTVPIDILLGKPRPRDIYVLCSDGLTKMVKDEKIAEIVSRSESTPATIVQQLIDTANENGGKDNVSVIVIRVVDPATAGGAAAKDAS